MFCPKCGGELPDSATFCNKCGAKVAKGESTQPATSPSQSRPATSQSSPKISTAALAAQGGPRTMAIVRVALGVIAIVLVFLPWFSIEYTGALTGRSSQINNMFELASGGVLAGWVPVVYIVSAALLIIGALVELISHIEPSRWVSLLGAVVMVLVAAIFVLNGDASESANYGIASLEYGPTIVPWIAAILGLAGAVTCFIKRR